MGNYKVIKIAINKLLINLFENVVGKETVDYLMDYLKLPDNQDIARNIHLLLMDISIRIILNNKEYSRILLEHNDQMSTYIHKYFYIKFIDQLNFHSYLPSDYKPINIDKVIHLLYQYLLVVDTEFYSTVTKLNLVVNRFNTIVPHSALAENYSIRELVEYFNTTNKTYILHKIDLVSLSMYLIYCPSE